MMGQDILSNREDMDDIMPYVHGERNGVVKLSVPVANILEDHSLYATLAGVTDTVAEHIIYYSHGVVTDPKDSGMRVGSIVSFKEAEEAKKNTDFDIVYGVDGLEFLIKQADLRKMYDESREVEKSAMQEYHAFWDAHKESDDLTEEEEGVVKNIQKKLDKARHTINALIYYRKNGFDRLVIREIPVFSVQTRAILEEELQYQPYAANDLERLLGRVIARNVRLRKLTDLYAPDIILVNESRMLQEYVDSFLANGKRGKPVVNNNGRPLISLQDLICRNVEI